MNRTLPRNAEGIGCLWKIEEGGFGITSRTDAAGQPIIGIFPLNRFGLPAGRTAEFPFRDHLIIRLIAGYDARGRGIVVYADTTVTMLGIKLRVLVPPFMIMRGLRRYFFVPWTEPLPIFTKAPANSNWSILPMPREVFA